MSGKGDKPRPMSVSRAEYELRWDLAFGRITPTVFEKGMRKLRKVGKLKRKWEKMK